MTVKGTYCTFRCRRPCALRHTWRRVLSFACIAILFIDFTILRLACQHLSAQVLLLSMLTLGFLGTCLGTCAVVVLFKIVSEAWIAYQAWSILRPIPAVPAGHFIWGQVPEILSEEAPLHLAEWGKKYGSIYKIRTLWKWAVVVLDPAIAGTSAQTIIKARKFLSASAESHAWRSQT